MEHEAANQYRKAMEYAMAEGNDTFDLFLAPGEADSEDLAEFFSAVSTLATMLGYGGVSFSVINSRETKSYGPVTLIRGTIKPGEPGV